MFENFQLFDDLSTREIRDALKSVMTKDKALIVLLPSSRNLRLVPAVETDVCFVGKGADQRESESLEALKVASGGYNLDGQFGNPAFTNWLYEADGLRELLKSYTFKAGLFWVYDGSRLAADLISSFKSIESGKSYRVHVNTVISEKGTILKALQILTFYNKERSKANDLCAYAVSLGSLGVADVPATPNIDPTGKEHKITPKGGDRLTEKLYDFAHEVGVQSVTSKNFKQWLSEIHMGDFDVSHDIISYIQKNGKPADVNNANLYGRIYRMKNPKIAR